MKLVGRTDVKERTLSAKQFCMSTCQTHKIFLMDLTFKWNLRGWQLKSLRCVVFTRFPQLSASPHLYLTFICRKSRNPWVDIMCAAGPSSISQNCWKSAGMFDVQQTFTMAGSFSWPDSCRFNYATGRPAANQYISTGILKPLHSSTQAWSWGHKVVATRCRSGLKVMQWEPPERHLQGSNWRQYKLHCCGSPPPTLAPTLLSARRCACAAILFAFPTHCPHHSFLSLSSTRLPLLSILPIPPTLFWSHPSLTLSLAKKEKKKKIKKHAHACIHPRMRPCPYTRQHSLMRSYAKKC